MSSRALFSQGIVRHNDVPRGAGGGTGAGAGAGAGTDVDTRPLSTGSETEREGMFTPYAERTEYRDSTQTEIAREASLLAIRLNWAYKTTSDPVRGVTKVDISKVGTRTPSRTGTREVYPMPALPRVDRQSDGQGGETRKRRVDTRPHQEDARAGLHLGGVSRVRGMEKEVEDVKPDPEGGPSEDEGPPRTPERDIDSPPHPRRSTRGPVPRDRLQLGPSPQSASVVQGPSAWARFDFGAARALDTPARSFSFNIHVEPAVPMFTSLPDIMAKVPERVSLDISACRDLEGLSHQVQNCVQLLEWSLPGHTVFSYADSLVISCCVKLSAKRKEIRNRSIEISAMESSIATYMRTMSGRHGADTHSYIITSLPRYFDAKQAVTDARREILVIVNTICSNFPYTSFCSNVISQEYGKEMSLPKMRACMLLLFKNEAFLRSIGVSILSGKIESVFPFAVDNLLKEVVGPLFDYKSGDRAFIGCSIEPEKYFRALDSLIHCTTPGHDREGKGYSIWWEDDDRYSSHVSIWINIATSLCLSGAMASMRGGDPEDVMMIANVIRKKGGNLWTRVTVRTVGDEDTIVPSAGNDVSIVRESLESAHHITDRDLFIKVLYSIYVLNPVLSSLVDSKTGVQWNIDTASEKTGDLMDAMSSILSNMSSSFSSIKLRYSSEYGRVTFYADNLPKMNMEGLMFMKDLVPARVYKAYVDAKGEEELAHPPEYDDVTSTFSFIDPFKRMNLIIAMLENTKNVYSLPETSSVVSYQIQILHKFLSRPESTLAQHYGYVLSGNSGVGKTFLANRISEFLSTWGILLSAHQDKDGLRRADLIGQYVGHTAPKTLAHVHKTLEGQMFVDEAYSLHSGSNEDYGAEAITTLVEEATKYSGRWVLCLAGYPRKMFRMMEANQGLASRLTVVEIPDLCKESLRFSFCAKASGIMDPSSKFNVDMKASSRTWGWVFQVLDAVWDRDQAESKMIALSHDRMRLTEGLEEVSESAKKHAARIRVDAPEAAVVAQLEQLSSSSLHEVPSVSDYPERLRSYIETAADLIRRSNRIKDKLSSLVSSLPPTASTMVPDEEREDLILKGQVRTVEKWVSSLGRFLNEKRTFTHEHFSSAIGERVIEMLGIPAFKPEDCSKTFATVLGKAPNPKSFIGASTICALLEEKKKQKGKTGGAAQ